ncbi:MAG: hypothetical protein IPK26_22955 [Planctomycetes bacterium]|nr:hypothetical protein [Planctomycetota bacterium]
MNTMPPPGRNTFLSLLVLLTGLLTACCNKKNDSPPPVSQDYLSEVTVPNDHFRWTPRRGATSVVVPVEIDDVNVPPEWNSSMLALVEQARDAWKPAIREARAFDTSTRRLGNQSPFAADYTKLSIVFTSRLGGSRVGQVEYRRSGATFVTGMTMTIAMRSPLDGRLLTNAELLAVLLHEFGHAYGLFNFGSGDSHSSSPADVMYHASTATNLSARDNATIRKHYGLTPTAVRADSLAAAGSLMLDTLAVAATH